MDTGMTDSAVHQAAVAIAAAHIIEFAKSVPGLGFLQNPVAAKCAAFLFVLAGAIGVHMQLDEGSSLAAGGRLILAWPMASVMMDAAEHTIIQWAFQEGYYQKFVRKP